MTYQPVVRIIVSALLLLEFAAATCSAQETAVRLKHVPSPASNPLKGLVPYAGDYQDRFPHSMEFNYLPLSELLIAEDTYDWHPLERLLNEITSRRHQTVFRVWMEYPGHKKGIPPFLEKQGVKVTDWLNTNTEPFPPTRIRTPDYEDPRLRKALTKFVAAMGKRYDGDARIGFITAGLLGTWGEWHSHPRNDLMASKEVQIEVMDAYEASFKKTPVLLRYPAGPDTYAHAPNHTRRLGYHDDSFAWATLSTGKKEDSWFFVPAMKSAGAGAIAKWKTAPIGGEIRPELWGQIFDAQPKHPKAQDFRKSVDATHATWLMDSGMFQEKQSPSRIRNAIQEVQHMGYEFHVTSTAVEIEGDTVSLSANVQNLGVAPFYYDWKIEVAAFDSQKQPLATAVTHWSVAGLLPEESPRSWSMTLSKDKFPDSATCFAMRIVNPMKNGLPLFFANEESLQLGEGWLMLGNVSED